MVNDDMPVGKKRSATNMDGSSRPIKKRASTACQACRSRKVRCNVLECGPPCTNCRLDDVSCTISIGKRRLGMSSGNAEAVLLFSDHTLSAATCDPPALQSSNGSCSSLPTDSPKNSEPEGMEKSCQKGISEPGTLEMDLSSEHSYRYQRNPPGVTEQAAIIIPPLPSPSRTDSGLTIELAPLMVNTGLVLGSVPALPSWIKPLPSRIRSDDIEFLSRKGALSVSDGALMSELLESFIQWVYPWSPVVSLDDLLNLLSSDNSKPEKFSLLLLQAIMFAGAGFADLSVLKNAGFPSRKDARRHFFNRCKLLYDFEYEDDRLTLIQALVLMTYWHESADDQKDIWHWICVAVALAHTIGLTHDPDTLEISSKQKRLRRRIWWSLFMRDRLVALAMRRTTRIQLHESHVSRLGLQDFDIASLPEFQGSASLRQFLGLPSLDQQSRLALLCIENVNLCMIIGRILEVQYSATCVQRRAGAKIQPNTTTTMVLLPREVQQDTFQIMALETMLSVWFSSLSTEISYDLGRSSHIESHETDLTLHRAVLAMMYYTAVNILFRPSFLSHSSSGPRLTIKTESYRDATFICRRTREAASNVTQIAEELKSMDLIRYLPTTGVTAMVHAAMLQLHDAPLQDQDIGSRSRADLTRSMDTLGQLCEIYIAADIAVHLLNQGIAKAGLGLPLREANISCARSQVSQLSVSEPTKQPRSDALPDMGASVDDSAAIYTISITDDLDGATPLLLPEPPAEFGDFDFTPILNDNFTTWPLTEQILEPVMDFGSVASSGDTYFSDMNAYDSQLDMVATCWYSQSLLHPEG